MRYTSPGITLMEVMVSMVIFSLMVGLSAGFISTGVRRSTLIGRPEPWLVYLEMVNQSFQQIPVGITPSMSAPPFSELPVLEKGVSLTMRWKKSDVPSIKAAIFTIRAQRNRTFTWRLYKKVP